MRGEVGWRGGQLAGGGAGQGGGSTMMCISRVGAARLNCLSPTSSLFLQGIMSDGAEMYMHMIIKFYSYLLRSRKL